MRLRKGAVLALEPNLSPLDPTVSFCWKLNLRFALFHVMDPDNLIVKDSRA